LRIKRETKIRDGRNEMNEKEGSVLLYWKWKYAREEEGLKGKCYYLSNLILENKKDSVLRKIKLDITIASKETNNARTCDSGSGPNPKDQILVNI